MGGGGDDLESPPPNRWRRVTERGTKFSVGHAAQPVEGADCGGPYRGLYIDKVASGLIRVSCMSGTDRLTTTGCALSCRWRFGVLVAGWHRSADGLFQQEAGSNDHHANHGRKCDPAGDHEHRQQD